MRFIYLVIGVLFTCPTYAQTPGNFVSNTIISSSAVNTFGATKQDINGDISAQHVVVNGVTQTVGTWVSSISAVRVITSGDATVTNTDHVIIINKTTGSATNVILPTSPSGNPSFIIKDGKGDAAINNITLLGTIDGVNNLVMSLAYESITLTWNGSSWSII